MDKRYIPAVDPDFPWVAGPWRIVTPIDFEDWYAQLWEKFGPEDTGDGPCEKLTCPDSYERWLMETGWERKLMSVTQVPGVPLEELPEWKSLWEEIEADPSQPKEHSHVGRWKTAWSGKIDYDTHNMCIERAI